MFVRNFLTAGDYMEIVPIGLPLSLKYDERGVLSGVLKGYDPASSDISDRLLLTLLNHCPSVPNSISLKEGTTFVRGVLYTGKTFKLSGKLPNLLESSIIEDFITNPDSYNFFAATVDSYAMVFRGSTSIRNWLKLSKFHVLPGYIIPSNLTEESFESLVNTETFNFVYPLISGFYVFHNDTGTYYDAGLRQELISSIDTNYNAFGRLMSTVSFESDSEDMVVDYSTVVSYNLHDHSLVIVDNENNIIYSIDSTGYFRSKTIPCPVCGRTIQVPQFGQVMCSDEHCNSRLYSAVCHFLSTLKLPEISFEFYEKFISMYGRQFEVPDILDAPMLRDTLVNTTLSELLRAIVPYSVVPANSTMLSSMCNACNNSLVSLDYYLDHLDRLESDTGVSTSPAFQAWIHSDINRINVNTLLHHERIRFQSTMKKFEGDPIFRGKRFYLTGEFTHGSHEDISAILRSYDGSVVTDYNQDFDCIVIGDTRENMNGAAIKSAARRHLYSFMESELFSKYNIDDDIQRNLG